MRAQAGPLPWPRWPLALPSWLYGGVMRLRNGYFDHWPAAARRVGVPVISVGNLSVGGTGKTPMVIEVVERLIERGRKPAVLTRGYAARGGEVADEVRELRAALPATPIVVNPRRFDGAQAAIRAGADCCVLDDGFQHRRLARDLEIVLLDALDPWGGGWMLPAGRLREPPDGLGRAGLVVITRANQVDDRALAALEAQVRALRGDHDLAFADVEIAGLTGINGCAVSLEALEYEAVLPVCGLGNPRTFERLVAEAAGRICPPLRMRDHHRYTPRDVRRILAAAADLGADRVVTTRKDWAKLAPLWPSDRPDAPPLARLDVRLLLRDDEPLAAAIDRVLGAARGGAP